MTPLCKGGYAPQPEKVTHFFTTFTDPSTKDLYNVFVTSLQFPWRTTSVVN